MIFNVLRAPLRTTAPILLRRNISSTAPRVYAPLLKAKPATSLTTSICLRYPKPTQIIVRSVASSVSGRPGSQTLEHAATNIREEVGNSAADLAKTIAGGNYFVDSVEPTQQTFVSTLLGDYGARL